MRRRLLIASLLGLVLLVLGAPAASAHGEHSQEPWLRMNTVGFWNVEFSTASVLQGEKVTITGTAKVLDTWPRALPDPETAFITVASPGPAFLLTDRVVNGLSAPASIYIERGGVYNFSVTLVGRVPGTYHIHPTFSVRSAGTLIGPGQDIKVRENPDGFTNPVTLYNGKTVNLETYGLAWPVMGFTTITFILGLIWLLYWIVPKPTVTRLAVTSQLSVNDDGGDAVGLVTKRDHRVMNWIMLATVVVLALGWIWQATAFRVKIPQQVNRFRVASAEQPPTFAKATMDKITFDRAGGTVTMSIQANNVGTAPMDLKAIHIANLTWGTNQGVLPERAVGPAELAPGGSIAPGETKALTLTFPANNFTQNDLIPLGTANTNMAATLEFTGQGGTSNFITVQRFLTPTFS